MKSFDESVANVQEILDELTAIAAQIRDVSLNKISQEELNDLQKQQLKIIEKLEKADHHLQKNYGNEIDKKTHKEFKSKLLAFQKLNQEFIEHLTASQGLIQFDLEPSEDQEELPTNLSKITIDLEDE